MSASASASSAAGPQQQRPAQRDAADGFDDEGVSPSGRDRQARGKDPYRSDASDGDDGFGRGLRTAPFEERERRAFALAVLDSPEQLMMYAQSANDSIPSQRRRFRAMLAGLEPLPASQAAEAGGPAPSSPPGARSRDARAKGKRPAAAGASDARGEWMG